MKFTDAIATLEAMAVPAKATEMAEYHGAERRYLGIANPVLDGLAKEWRGDDLDARIALASALWDTDIHEARITAAKLMTQARLRPDDGAAWALICAWVPDCDGVAIADQVGIAGQKRVVWDTARLDEIEAWVGSENVWARRAVLSFTQPWTKQTHMKDVDEAIRDRILRWCSAYAEDHDPVIQRALAWWLRDLSRHDAARVEVFLEEHGEHMTRSARREAGQMLKRK